MVFSRDGERGAGKRDGRIARHDACGKLVGVLLAVDGVVGDGREAQLRGLLKAAETDLDEIALRHVGICGHAVEGALSTKCRGDARPIRGRNLDVHVAVDLGYGLRVEPVDVLDKGEAFEAVSTVLLVFAAHGDVKTAVLDDEVRAVLCTHALHEGAARDARGDVPRPVEFGAIAEEDAGRVAAGLAAFGRTSAHDRDVELADSLERGAARGRLNGIRARNVEAVGSQSSTPAQSW